MTSHDPVELLGALADESRLRAFAALVLGARTTQEVAQRAGLSARDALRVLARLEAAGLATRRVDAWEPDTHRLRDAVAATREKSDRLDYLEAGAGEAGVLRTFMPYGRLPGARGRHTTPRVPRRLRDSSPPAHRGGDSQSRGR